MTVMSQAQAEDLVRRHAEAVAEVLGVDAESAETRINASPCQTGMGELAVDGVFYVQGNWQMPLPPGEHAETLERLRDLWTVQGFQIKKFQMFSDTEGVIIGESPDELEVMVESATPPIAVAVMILTPCYQPAATAPAS